VTRIYDLLNTRRWLGPNQVCAAWV